ncbi:MAG: DEAD/DEAH box helicase [Bacteroidia bacterium]|nr:DEAD/DEAH box helicase [Bacteroidia bacterium]
MENNELSFSDFGLDERVLESILGIGYSKPTPVQAAAIPVIMSGSDLLATAQTGTGKTAAFVIPIVDYLMKNEDRKGIRVLIISPTRELAMQIDQAIDGLSYHTGVSSVAIFGGSDKQEFDRQMSAIQRGVDILVATPGRLLQHLNLIYSDFSSVELLVLDEADKMLDMGFYNDIMKIVKEINEKHQTLMFSATMPPKIKEFASKILKPDAQSISFKLSQPAEGATQEVYVVYENQKLPLLLHILKTAEIDSLIIFTSSKLKADEFHALIVKNKINACVFHSDIEQEQRIELMRKFKNKEYKVLVATDILSRGIDIDNLSHVVNVDVPHDAEDYIHRIGRTARSGRTGTAITFVSEKDQRKFASIERLIGKTIPKMEVPEFIGQTPEYSPFQHKKRPDSKSGPGNNRKEKPGGFQKQKPQLNPDNVRKTKDKPRNFPPKQLNTKPDNGEVRKPDNRELRKPPVIIKKPKDNPDKKE